MKTLFEKLISIFWGQPKPIVKDSLIPIPDGDLFYCIIETPEFKNGKIWKMRKQKGMIYKSNMKFVTSHSLTGYDVQFHSIEDLQKSLRRVL